jgi:integrase
MQKIVDRYPLLPTQYLLPIILREDGTERRQYLNKMLFVNRKLKVIGRSIRLDMPLSMYVARHSWASIARRRNIPLSIISEGMGHESENTTKIYLAAIQNSFVDRANRRIINCI